MKIRRDIASIPARSAAETWAAIIALVKHQGSIDIAQLEAAASVMQALIAEEHPSAQPIVFSGGGPRVVIYCVYAEQAMEMGLSIDPLPENPTKGDWRMTAPCDEDDVAWMNKTLAARASRLKVHSVKAAPAEAEPSKAASFDIDWGAVGRS